jgi:hypothetical protein
MVPCLSRRYNPQKAVDIAAGCLCLYPVLSDRQSALDYLTLDEALGQALIEIVEIDAAGS